MLIENFSVIARNPDLGKSYSIGVEAREGIEY
jgi:hypothetical protein